VKLDQSQLPTAQSENPSLAERSQYVWHPNADLELPAGFELVMNCDTGIDAINRFVPYAPTRAFILSASLAGQAILTSSGRLSREQSFSYHAMRLVFQRAGQFREYLGRHFRRKSELFITRAARLEHENKNVLPHDLGLDVQGRGIRWSVNELLKRGREAAITLGNNEPIEELWIRLGLLESARLNPFDPATLTVRESRSLVRQALFDLGTGTEVATQEQKDRVCDLLLAALEKHADDSTDHFRTWFFEQADNLIHQIAKKKKGGGPIDRTLVRQAMLEIVFDAHEYIADTILAWAHDFCRALPYRLSRADHDLFSLLYCKRRGLGGFPLIMLHERFEVIRECVVEAISAPTDKFSIGRLLRVLHYYAVMCRERRNADARWGQLRKSSNQDGKVPLSISLLLDQPDVVPQRLDLHEMKASLLQSRQLKCQCPTIENWRVTDFLNKDNGVVEVEFTCTTCEHAELIAATSEELRGISGTLRTRQASDEVGY